MLLYVQNHRSQELCQKVEVAVLGSPPLISLIVSVHVKQHLKGEKKVHIELRSCVNVVGAVLGSPSLMSIRSLWM